MKLLVAVLMALFAVSSVFAPALAASALPDYQKDGKMEYTFACDKGQSTVRKYTGEGWRVLEVQTAAGDVFVDLRDAELKFFMKLSSSSEMQGVTHKVWDENLQAKAPAVFYEMHGGGQSDCAKR